MKQHVELGKRLRAHYVDHLRHVSPTYNSHEVYVRATDVNRTLISAISVGSVEKGEEMNMRLEVLKSRLDGRKRIPAERGTA